MSRTKLNRTPAVLAIAAAIFAFAAAPAPADPLAEANLTLDELIAGSKKEGKLVFYTSIPVKSARVVLGKFGKKHPWLKTSFIRKGGPVLAQQFYADKKSGVEKADVVNSGAAEVYTDFSRNEGAARVIERYRSAALLSIATCANSRGCGAARYSIIWNAPFSAPNRSPLAPSICFWIASARSILALDSSGIARRIAKHSETSRMSNISTKSARLAGATRARRFGSMVTKPSASSCQIASRTGIRLTANRLARCSCPSGAFGGSTPETISSRRVSNIAVAGEVRPAGRSSLAPVIIPPEL